MKKILVAIVLLLVFNVSSNAQFRFGVKGGVNFSNFSTDMQTLKDNATAWHAGLVAQFKIPLLGLGIQPELLYTVSKSSDASIGYFQLPINLRVQLLPIPLIKPIILAGPYFGYAANFSGFADGDKDNIKRMDWGLGVGAGIEIWKLQIDGRYQWGLQNLSDNKEFKIKNNVFKISLSYFF